MYGSISVYRVKSIKRFSRWEEVAMQNINYLIMIIIEAEMRGSEAN